MTNIIDDLSELSTINKKVFTNLLDKIIFCINDAIAESLLENKEITEVDIGLGTLIIKHTKEEIRYKFIPSAKFNSSINNTIVNGKSPLELVFEETLKNKLNNVYKDLI